MRASARQAIKGTARVIELRHERFDTTQYTAPEIPGGLMKSLRSFYPFLTPKRVTSPISG